ncbi:hypothetical protein DFJ73DRAFT_903768, partial [Zopfochytrium polystomum]
VSPLRHVRTTKTNQKLTIFPEDALASDQATRTVENGEVFPSQHHHALQPLTARAPKEEFLRRIDKNLLPRVTAYCTASSYNMDLLMEYLLSRKAWNGTSPKRFDEALYTPYTVSSYSDAGNNDLIDFLDPPDFSNAQENAESYPQTHPASFTFNTANFLADVLPNDLKHGGDYADLPGRNASSSSAQSAQDDLSYKELVRRTTASELFFFDYGVVVMWGFTEEEEKVILSDIRPFEEESIDYDEIEPEKFHFLYSRQQQARIYNDIITLISPIGSTMIKLTISHAFAQSAKLILFEGLIEETIESTRHIPNAMAETGKIHMSRKAINKKIGQLFIMRINVNLVSNVLDTPEIFWSEPALEPLYVAIRGYLEISQRVDVLNQRVGVISDLLAMLKDNLTSTHGEQLEWIVIFLISFEIVIGLITIAIDLSSYLRHIADGGGENGTSIANPKYM